MKRLFIVNPMSGKREAEEKLIPVIEKKYREQDIDCDIVLTNYPGHATEIVREYAARFDRVRVMACGGDGTLNEAVSGAVGCEHVTVGVFANGSGNDFIKCLGHPASAFQDLDLIETGVERKIDILRLNDRYCVNIASVGLDADVVAAVEKYRRFKIFRGPAAYNLGLLECVLKPRGKELRITADGKRYDNEYVILSAANGTTYGGGYYAAPEAKIDDGLIDVIMINNMKLPRIAKLIPIYKKGEHIKNGKVINCAQDVINFQRFSSILIESERDLVVNIDGEIIHAKKIDIGVQHNAVNFLVPDRKNS